MEAAYMQWSAQEETVLSRLEPSVAACIRRSVPLFQGILEEIRMCFDYSLFHKVLKIGF